MFGRRARSGNPDTTSSASYAAAVPVPVDSVAAELRARMPGLGVTKLHKLLYYCQGHHLATFGEPLFRERISAFDNGPVVGSLWHEERDAGSGPRGTDTPAATLGEAQLSTVGYVLSRYGALSRRDLINLTHEEAPWQQADRDRPPHGSAPIAAEWMEQYFRNEPDDDDEVELDPVAVAEWLREARTTPDRPSRPDDPEELASLLSELRSAERRRAR